MTKALTSAVGLRVVVPGTWANVPLDDPEKAAAYVKRLVRRQVGVADRLARMRRDAAQELLVTARDAVGIGVHTYLVSLEILPGVPFPAAMMMRDEPWPGQVPTASEDLGPVLASAFPGGEVAVQRNGPVVRVVEMTRGRTSDAADAVDVLSMRLEYRVPYPDRSRLLHVRVNVPDLPSAEPFATLFDEIVDSITFLEPVDAGDQP